MTFLLVLLGISAYAISIYDIQYTSASGIDNTYPSPYLGKAVTIEGIVTAINLHSGGYFLSEANGGMWRSIHISDKRSNVSIGDRIQISGTVGESFGMTSILNPDRFRLLERRHPLPQPVNVTTGQLSRSVEAEAYEGVLVKITNATCSQVPGAKGRFGVTDGTGQCYVLTSSFGERAINLSPRIGDQYLSLTGVVTYSFGEYSLNLRERGDAVLMQPVFNNNRSWGRIKSIYK